jgi:hypothetical protein
MRALRYILAAVISLGTSAQACSLADISVKLTTVRFDKLRHGTYLKGTAVLTNQCQVAVGVQIQIVGYDKENAPVATRELWPASVRNIPPGEYIFSIDQWLDYEPGMKRIALKPVDIRHWKAS